MRIFDVFVVVLLGLILLAFIILLAPGFIAIPTVIKEKRKAKNQKITLKDVLYKQEQIYDSLAVDVLSIEREKNKEDIYNVNLQLKKSMPYGMWAESLTKKEFENFIGVGNNKVSSHIYTLLIYVPIPGIAFDFWGSEKKVYCFRYDRKSFKNEKPYTDSEIREKALDLVNKINFLSNKDFVLTDKEYNCENEMLSLKEYKNMQENLSSFKE